MYSKARRSADVLVAAAVVLVALAPASGVASIGPVEPDLLHHVEARLVAREIA